jgi:cytochrome c oxidase subunit 2
MTTLIVILAIVFLVLTFMVLSKTQSLLKANKADKETETNSRVDGANNANAIGLFVFWLFSIVGVIWSYFDAKQYFLPEASSIHGRETDFWFWTSMAVIMVGFFVVNSVLFYFPMKYAYKEGHRATFYADNHKLEIIWTAIPAVIMAGLVFTGLQVWDKTMMQAPPESEAEVIEVMGKQFGWQVRYPGVDNNKLGNYNYKLIDNTNEFGIDLSDANSFDDFTNNTELHIPKGKPVIMKIRSRDVLHSFAIPHMRVKMDAVPGMPTSFYFTADKSTNDMKAETGNADFKYEIACMEVCGRSHFAMKLTLVVDELEDYEAWKKSQKPFLTQNPDYLDKIPAALKAKAMKYTAVVADSTAVQ